MDFRLASGDDPVVQAVGEILFMHDAPAGHAVQFGEHQTAHRHGLREQLGLRQAVLARGAVDCEVAGVRPARDGPRERARAGGRAAVVIKNTFLSNSDNASVALRHELLESCNLHTVLDCPGGTFQGAGVKTVVLFFEKGSPTRKVWYYQLDPGRNLGKTNPLNDADLSEFIDLQKSFADSDHSWSLDVNDVDDATCDLSVKNPNRDDEVELRTPDAILEEIASLDAESANILNNIKTLVGS